MLLKAAKFVASGLAIGVASGLMVYSHPVAGAAAGNAFSFNWTGTPVAPLPWRPATGWQVSIHDRDLTQTYSTPYPFDMQHGSNCGPFLGFGVGGTHPATNYSDLTFICNNHMMTGINGQGYGEITFTPGELVDWSAGTATITFMVDTLRTSCRDWLSFNLMPFMDNLQFTDGVGVDLEGEPKNEIQINGHDSCPTAYTGTDIRNFNGNAIAGNGGSVSDVVSESTADAAKNRQLFEFDISSTHVRFGMPAFNYWFVDGNLSSPLPYSQGIIQFEQHEYTPDKQCTPTPTFCAANTWHWSNVSISSAVPFTILNGDAFQVDQYPSDGQIVRFPAPAPANSFLRFEELSAKNTMTVTALPSGQVFPVTHQQPGDKNTTGDLSDTVQNDIFMPIPTGTTAVTVSAQDPYWTSWLGRNFSIWSLTYGVPNGVPRALLPAVSNAAYGGYTTAAYIQNEGTAPAAAAILYYDSLGHPVGIGDFDVIPVNGTWVARQDNGRSFPAGGAGSAVVLSDQPVAAMVNEFAPGNSDATSYSAPPAASGSGTTLFAPAIANSAFGGYTTGIGLINAGSSTSSVTVTYRDGSGNVVKTQSLTALAPNAYAGLYSGDASLGLPAGFSGTATIQSSSGPVAAIVNETGPGGQFSSYAAVPAGAAKLFAPVVLNNAYGGYFTGMGVQNTSATAGVLTVNYYDSSGNATPKTFNLQPNGSLSIYQGSATDGPAPGAYVASLSSTVPVVAIVNEVAPSSGGSQQSTAYNAVPAGGGTVHLPLVESAGPDSLSTGEGIMNTGSAVTTVTVTYFDAGTGLPVGTPQTQLLQPNASWGVYQPAAGLPSGARATAVITTSTGGQIAVVCNESNATSLMSYGGQ